MRFFSVLGGLVLGACGTLVGSTDEPGPDTSQSANDASAVGADASASDPDATVDGAPPGADGSTTCPSGTTADATGKACVVGGEPTCSSAVTPEAMPVVGSVCGGKSIAVTHCDPTKLPAHAFRAGALGTVEVTAVGGPVELYLVSSDCTFVLVGTCASIADGQKGSLNVSAGQLFVVANPSVNGCVNYKLKFTPAL